MRIYSPQESKQFISKADISGDVFEYKNEKDYGVYGDIYNEIPKNLIKGIINDIDFPLDKVDVPLFSLPFRLMVYEPDKNGVYRWTGMEYNGRAYPTHVLFGATKRELTKLNVGALIIHELGHIICYKYVDPIYDKIFTPKFKEYLKIRGAENWNDDTIQWDKRASELFAEDFRYLFGTKYMHDGDIFGHYKYIEPPTDEIKQWFLSLVE